MSHTPEEIIQASKTAFIDMQVNSNLAIRPKFISNDYKRGLKVLSSIERARGEGVKGRIMMTNYLTFSKPEALKN